MSEVIGCIEVLPNPLALAHHVAEWIVEAATAAQGSFRVSLSGGSTPKTLYGLLASNEFKPRFPWERVSWYWGDERFVPYDDPESNFRMTREAMLAKAPVPSENIHPVPTDGSPEDAARRYELTLQQAYGGATLDPHRPLFDVTLLGLGPDGHTASLFPHSPGLSERQAWVLANWVEKFGTHRLSLSFPVLDAGTAVLFLVAGADKEWALHQVLQGGASVADVPARGVRPATGALTFLVDRAAAAGLVLRSA